MWDSGITAFFRVKKKENSRSEAPMNRRGPETSNDYGASEVVGIILLVSMIVLAFGIVSLVLVSQPQKTQVPEISAVIGNGTNATTGQNVVYITHSGGDSLKGNQYLIFVNHIDRTSQITGNGTMDWNVGETLFVSMGNETPVLVQIYYQGPTESDLLVEHTLQPGVPTVTTTVTVTMTTTITPSPGAPVADFVANTTCGYSPAVIGFSDRSTGSPVSWSWNFGDGSISSEQNPVHMYTAPGTYSVTLFVTNAFGSDTKTVIGYINVYHIDFTASPQSGNAPLTVSFTDLSTGSPVSWLWSFGDGTTSSDRNPTHTYTDLGSYPVSLTVTTAGCGSGTVTKTGLISVTRTGSGSVINLTKACGNNGRMIDGTYFTWVAGNGESLSVNGINYHLINNDLIRLEINGDQKTGQMVIDNQNFLTFTFSTRFYRNNNLVATGSVTGLSGIKLNKNDNHGTLTYVLERCPSMTMLILDGVTIINSSNNNAQMTISNMNIIHDNRDPYVNDLFIYLDQTHNQINCQGDIVVS
jgi:PKD repeat protein